MGRGWVVAWGLLLLGGAAQAGEPESYAICAKKRVDACGCHSVYGIRHCHPNRRTDHCESPVKAKASQPKPAKKVHL